MSSDDDLTTTGFPRARPGHVWTSHEAAASLSEGEVRAHYAILLDTLRTYGPGTIHDIAARCSLSLASVHKRLPELLAQKKVWRPPDMWGVGPSGRRCKVWQIGQPPAGTVDDGEAEELDDNVIVPFVPGWNVQHEPVGFACEVCGREAMVFDWAPTRPPRRTCTNACNEIAEVFGVGTTEMERIAIREARRSLYEALVRIGKADAFESATAEDMDSVIEAVWDGLRASMHRQSAAGEIPF